MKFCFVHVNYLLKIFYKSKRDFIMDLGINGMKAIVCASSRGLGYGCAEALVQAGVDLTITEVTSQVIGFTLPPKEVNFSK